MVVIVLASVAAACGPVEEPAPRDPDVTPPPPSTACGNGLALVDVEIFGRASVPLKRADEISFTDVWPSEKLGPRPDWFPPYPATWLRQGCFELGERLTLLFDHGSNSWPYAWHVEDATHSCEYERKGPDGSLLGSGSSIPLESVSAVYETPATCEFVVSQDVHIKAGWAYPEGGCDATRGFPCDKGWIFTLWRFPDCAPMAASIEDCKRV